jgi:hypothetical protein
VKWKCTSQLDVLDVADRLATSDLSCIGATVAVATVLQKQYTRKETARVSAASRLPDTVRKLYREASFTRDEGLRRSRRLEAKSELANFLKYKKQQQVIHIVRGGGVLAKSKSLHHIASARGFDNNEAGACAIASDFSSNWACDDPGGLQVLDSFLLSLGPQTVDFQQQDVIEAFSRIKNKTAIGADGTCPLVWELLFLAHPDWFVRLVCVAITSREQLANLRIQARIFGKESADPAPDQCRAILPLCPILQLFDALLAGWMNKINPHFVPCGDELWEGAIKGTQCLNIASTLHIAQEKILDTASAGAIAQCDIRRYYDSISVVMCLQYLVSLGAPLSLILAIALCQLCVPVTLNVLGVGVDLGQRTLGAITGTRVAGTLARVPVRAVVGGLRHKMQACAFKAGEFRPPVLSWVGNLFFVASSASAAVEFFTCIETGFKKWGLGIKDVSRALLAQATTGGQGGQCGVSGRWDVVSSCPCLGHSLDANGGIASCWRKAKRAAWRAFWGNCGAAKGAPIAEKLRLLSRCVWPAFGFRVSRWPPSPFYLAEVKSLQRKMVSILLALARSHVETHEAFRSRRARKIDAIVVASGCWAQAWRKRWSQWDKHLQRHPEHPASRLLEYRDRKWLMSRRASFLPSFSISNCRWSATAGRTRTRAVPGFVATRWEDARASPESLPS